MKLKFLLLLLVIASLFSFALDTNTFKQKVRKSDVVIDNTQLEKEPMQPFTLIDRNQFD